MHMPKCVMKKSGSFPLWRIGVIVMQPRLLQINVAPNQLVY